MPTRPRINIEPTKTDKALEIAGWASLLLLWVLTLRNYYTLPGTIPTHFNFYGKVDNYGSKATIMMLPLAGTFLYLTMTLLNKYPHVFNYPVPITENNARTQYTMATRMIRIMKLSVVIIFTMLIIFMFRVIDGQAGSLGFWFIPLILGIFIVLTAGYVYKTYKAK